MYEIDRPGVDAPVPQGTTGSVCGEAIDWCLWFLKIAIHDELIWHRHVDLAATVIAPAAEGTSRGDGAGVVGARTDLAHHS